MLDSSKCHLSAHEKRQGFTVPNKEGHQQTARSIFINSLLSNKHDNRLLLNKIFLNFHNNIPFAKKLMRAFGFHCYKKVGDQQTVKISILILLRDLRLLNHVF